MFNQYIATQHPSELVVVQHRSDMPQPVHRASGSEAALQRPPLEELSWDDLYISQELRTAYFYYKLGASRIMNNQQSFLVATLKENNCPVLSHEQIAAIQMKLDPNDFDAFHHRPSKWSTKYFTSTELHRAYMHYSEELSRFSHIGRSAQQMEKALNAAECPVLSRYDIADIQRQKRRELLAMAQGTTPDGQPVQPTLLRKRRVVRRKTGLIESPDVVLAARTRQRVPKEETKETEPEDDFNHDPSQPVRRQRNRPRASPYRSPSVSAQAQPFTSLQYSFETHLPPLPPSTSYYAQAQTFPSAPLVHSTMQVGQLDQPLAPHSPFKLFEGDPLFAADADLLGTGPSSPVSVSSSDWDSAASDSFVLLNHQQRDDFTLTTCEPQLPLPASHPQQTMYLPPQYTQQQLAPLPIPGLPASYGPPLSLPPAVTVPPSFVDPATAWTSQFFVSSQEPYTPTRTPSVPATQSAVAAPWPLDGCAWN